MKIVVYSALFGNQDPLWSVPPTAQRNATYVLFTEKKRREVGLWTGFRGTPEILRGTNTIACPQPTWEQRIVKFPHGYRMSARYAKAMAHELLPEADFSIWVDSNIRLLIAPRRAIKWLRSRDFAGFKHPDRDCIYEEIKACKVLRKSSIAKLSSQRNAYKRAGMPKHRGLLSTRSFIRKHTPRIAELNELWWEELLKRSERDQVSLPFVCWKMGLKWSHIPGKATECTHYWFVPHGRELTQ